MEWCGFACVEDVDVALCLEERGGIVDGTRRKVGCCVVFWSASCVALLVEMGPGRRRGRGERKSAKLVAEGMEMRMEAEVGFLEVVRWKVHTAMALL